MHVTNKFPTKGQMYPSRPNANQIKFKPYYPVINPKTPVYRCDGSGRDKYIEFNGGGYFSTISSTTLDSRILFKSSLRTYDQYKSKHAPPRPVSTTSISKSPLKKPVFLKKSLNVTGTSKICQVRKSVKPMDESCFDFDG